METRLTIKNFRVFDENGVTFDLKPITFMTGTNSSGKSTVVKAVFLLNSFLSQIKEAIDNGVPIELEKYKLDFTKYPNNLLGRFDKIVHEGSESKSITLEYTVHSLLLSKDVNVQLVFSANENDELNNAYLDSITMSIDDGVFYSTCKSKQSYCNLNIIKEDYIAFLLAGFAAYRFLEIETNGNDSIKNYNDVIEDLSSVDKLRRDDVLRYIRTTERSENLITELVANPSVIAQLQNKESILEIPVLDTLSEFQKAEIDSFITSEYLKYESEALVCASHKVVKSFMESKFDNFKDFFRHSEVVFFDQVTCNSSFSAVKQKNLHLLSASELTLSRDHVSNTFFTIFNDIAFNDGEKGFYQRINKQEITEEWENRPLTFEVLYEVVMEWNKKATKDYKFSQSYNYDELDLSNPNERVYHTTYKLFTKFAEELVQEVICPNWSGIMSYVSSSRANVSRLYTLDDSSDFSILLQNYFEKKRLFEQYQKESPYKARRKYRANQFMNRWINKFEIGEAIKIRADHEGLGVSIRLHKTKKSKGRLLADEGYGITQLVSILLQIETAILSAQGENVNKFSILDALDHYDSNQFHYEVNTIAIEEPEIHLHPKYQSLLADMFLEAYEKYNIHFIIETHSEYLIRKAQVFVARHEYENEEAMNLENPFKVYYVSREDKPCEMEFQADGRFKNEFGKGFFDEATNLAFEIL